jgi:hypothetical protein
MDSLISTLLHYYISAYSTSSCLPSLQQECSGMILRISLIKYMICSAPGSNIYILLYAFIRVRYNQSQPSRTIQSYEQSQTPASDSSLQTRTVSFPGTLTPWSIINIAIRKVRDNTLKFWGIFLYCFALTIAPIKIDDVFGLPGSYIVFWSEGMIWI